MAGDTITDLEVPTWALPGYDFLGWYYMDDSLEGVKNPPPLSELNNLEGYIMPSGGINLGALFKARTDTPYTLHYYVETTAGTGAYELYKTSAHQGITDSYIPTAGLINRTKTDLAGALDGLKLRYDLLFQSDVSLHGDGSGSGDIYLDRESYFVYYHTNNKDYVGASVIQTGGVYGGEGNSVEIPQPFPAIAASPEFRSMT